MTLGEGIRPGKDFAKARPSQTLRLPKAIPGGNIGWRSCQTAKMPATPGDDKCPTVSPFRSVGYPIRIHGGTGVLSRLGEEVDRFRGKRAFVVCGQTVARPYRLA